MLSVLALSCSDSQRFNLYMEDAAQSMESDTERSLSLLNLVADSINCLSTNSYMRYYMLQAEVSNKLDLQMPSDTIFKEVVDYYDNHGDANEQMKAHYLLGCIYRDLKNAPMALQCYLDATDKADTTCTDCDFLTMMCIYGQMALVYHSQAMPRKAIDAYEQYSHYAKRANYMIESIRGQLFKVEEYQMLQDTASILSTTERVRQMYLDCGLKQEAAGVYMSAIGVYVNQRKLSKARKYMDIFEQESGLFDSEGNIHNDYVSYYEVKGWYFNHAEKLDSAEFYFNKLLSCGNTFEAYRGLLSVYKKRNTTEEILRIIPLYENEINKLVNRFHTNAMRQVDAMYDHAKLEYIAQRKTIEAMEMTNYIIALIAILLLILSISLFLLYRNHCQKNKMLLLEKRNAILTQTNENTWEKISILKEEKEETGKTIDKLINDISTLKQQMGNNAQKDDIDTIRKSDIYEIIKRKASFSLKNKQMTQEEWEQFEKSIELELPLFYSNLIHSNIKAHERKICMLIRIGFTSIEIMTLMNLSRSNFGNIKLRINKKLFNIESATNLYEHLMEL